MIGIDKFDGSTPNLRIYPWSFERNSFKYGSMEGKIVQGSLHGEIGFDGWCEFDLVCQIQNNLRSQEFDYGHLMGI